MTNDEKAKAYDMALEAARKELGVDREEWEVVQRVLHNIFPELRESEEERIIKCLMEIVNLGCSKNISVEYDVNLTDIRKWLEKQKEQKPELPKPHKGDDTNPYDMSVSQAQEYAFHRGFGIPFNGGEVYVDERHLTQTIGNILRWADEHPKEQKPAEWKPQPESLEALMYAIEGKWNMILPTSYLSRRLEDLYEGLVNTFNVDESFLTELPKVASRTYTEKDIEELRALKDKIDASMEQKPAEKQDYSGLNDLERAILRGFLAAGVENVPVEIIKETAKECFAQMKPAEWSEEDSLLEKCLQEIDNATWEIRNRLKSLRPQSKEELAKMLQDEYNKGKETGEREGYTKGYNKGYKDANESVYHFPVMPITPFGWGCDGIHCINPQMDCINCPRQNGGGKYITSPNTASGESKLEAHWKPSDK